MKSTQLQTTQPDKLTTLLADEVMKRMRQLNYSRRELAIRAGLSRQTLHHIELGRTTLQPQTLAALDAALQWPTGTAGQLAAGNADALSFDPETERYMLTTYKWRVVQYLETLTLEELEALILNQGWTLEDDDQESP